MAAAVPNWQRRPSRCRYLPTQIPFVGCDMTPGHRRGTIAAVWRTATNRQSKEFAVNGSTTNSGPLHRMQTKGTPMAEEKSSHRSRHDEPVVADEGGEVKSSPTRKALLDTERRRLYRRRTSVGDPAKRRAVTNSRRTVFRSSVSWPPQSKCNRKRNSFPYGRRRS